MIIRVIVQNQYKEELHDNEWFSDIGDWRSAEGYASSKLFGFWRQIVHLYQYLSKEEKDFFLLFSSNFNSGVQ